MNLCWVPLLLLAAITSAHALSPREITLLTSMCHELVESSALAPSDRQSWERLHRSTAEDRQQTAIDLNAEWDALSELQTPDSEFSLPSPGSDQVLTARITLEYMARHPAETAAAPSFAALINAVLLEKFSKRNPAFDLVLQVPGKIEVQADGDNLRVTPQSPEEVKVKVHSGLHVGRTVCFRGGPVGSDLSPISERKCGGLEYDYRETEFGVKNLSHHPHFMMECQIIVFETDEKLVYGRDQPAWSPKEGQRYQVLWSRTLAAKLK